jgi:iron complex transport system substrate-binding protein
VITDTEAAIDASARAHPQFAGRTITVASDYAASGIDYYTVTDGTAEQIVTRMGFAPNPLAQNFAGAARVSDEQLDLLDADVLLMFYRDATTREERLAQPLFQRVPAIVEGRYVGITADEPEAELTWVLRRGASALSVPWAVEVIAERVGSVDMG